MFWLYVNLQSILNAFRVESNGEVIWSFINWKYFWEDLTRSGSMVDMALILRNTLIFFFTNVGVILPISFIFSYFLYILHDTTRWPVKNQIYEIDLLLQGFFAIL